MQQPVSYTDRVRAQPHAQTSHRRAFHHPRTSYGVAGHWIHLLSVLAPLVIGELIKDPEKKWKAIRLASVGTAVLTEGMWTYRVKKRREDDEQRLALAFDCSPQV